MPQKPVSGRVPLSMVFNDSSLGFSRVFSKSSLASRDRMHRTTQETNIFQDVQGLNPRASDPDPKAIQRLSNLKHAALNARKQEFLSCNDRETSCESRDLEDPRNNGELPTCNV